MSLAESQVARARADDTKSVDGRATTQAMAAKKTGAAKAPERVLIYAMNYTPELIGCGRYTGEIGAYLSEQGTQVEVVTTPPHYPGWQARDGYQAGRYVTEVRDGVRIHRCPIGLSKNMKGFGRAWAPISWALSSAPVVLSRILSFKPTHVFCIEPTLFASPVALIAAKLVRARTVLHVQDLEIDAAFAVGHMKSGALQSLVTAFEKHVLKAFDRIVTISFKMREKLRDKGVPSHKLGLVRNWVDASHIYPLTTPNDFRAELGLAECDFVALYAGNIGIKQALMQVMDAAATLVDTPITFVIVGDGPEKAALVARNLPNVKFLPLQPEARLNALLNLADVHLLPQDKGAADLVLPSKLGGILASGRPLIAMADAGTEIHEFLAAEAILIPCGDSTAMAQSLRDQVARPRAIPDPSRSDALKALGKREAMAELLSQFARAQEA